MAEGDMKMWTLDEIAEHNNAASTWIIIDDKVYDVTKFVDEHPGGEEVMLEQAGRDATASFYDVGHSNDAKQIAAHYLIGRVNKNQDSQTSAGDHVVTSGKVTWSDIILSPTWSNFLIPAVISVIVYGTYSGVKALFS